MTDMDDHFADKTQAIEQLWREYFADPHQWWDNRLQKVSPGVVVGQLLMGSYSQIWIKKGGG